MKISFITTVFNEEEGIDRFLDSLLIQTKLPNEFIIVDGGSTDKTLKKINYYESVLKKKKVIIKIIIKKGNRSIGRNEAVKNATGEIIVCSDSGNILDKKWLENIIKPFKNKRVDVVAGYYKGNSENLFQKCLIPYALVMPDKVNPSNFLPATRSIAFTKAIWKKVGGFNEQFSHNEDYVFANKLKELKANIIFEKDAIVEWIPRNNLKEAFIMFFRFALGDAEAGIFRPKVMLVFIRYIFIIMLLFLPLYFLLFLLLYILWAFEKNYHYVNDLRAIFILPALQFTADFAILTGTLWGVLQSKK